MKKLILMVALITGFASMAQCDQYTADLVVQPATYNTNNMSPTQLQDSSKAIALEEYNGEVVIEFTATTDSAVLIRHLWYQISGCADVEHTMVIYDDQCNVVSNNYTGGQVLLPYTTYMISNWWSYTLIPCETYSMVVTWQTIDASGSPCTPNYLHSSIGLSYFPLGDTVGCTNYGVGMEDVVAPGVKVYPNPTTDNVTITLTGYIGETLINIYDISGRQIQELTTTGVSVNLHLDVAPGTYILTVTQEGLIRKKLIIKQ